MIEKGAFHRWLGKNEKEPITEEDIQKGLASNDPHVRKMAQFAKNLRGLKETKLIDILKILKESQN